VAVAARDALAALTAQPAIDVLCNAAIQNPQAEAARICLEQRMGPSDHERKCLFLFVTRQLDEYFKEDFEFQSLRLEYDRADATVKGNVMEVVRSGDRRCAGFIQAGRGGGKVGAKPLSECTENEVKFALESWTRHQQWDRLLHACLELPLKHGLPALEELRKSGWEPEAPELKSVLKQVLVDSRGFADSRRSPQTDATSSVFERWLAEGQGGEHAALDMAEIERRLQTADPPEGVTLVAALATKTEPGSPAAEAVRKSPHWLVRLAGFATGLTVNPAQDKVEDDNFWVRELAAAANVLDFWPGKATPNDLEALSSAPAEAWAGRLGAARKVLRTVMAHRIDSGVFEPVVVEAHEFAAEFVQPGDDVR
jgi:hypothetical protein